MPEAWGQVLFAHNSAVEALVELTRMCVGATSVLFNPFVVEVRVRVALSASTAAELAVSELRINISPDFVSFFRVDGGRICGAEVA